MHIIIKSTNLELTQTLRDYTEKRLSGIEKFVGNDGQVAVELEKTTNHHKQGDIFRAEVNVTTSVGALYRSASEKDDLYAAIDDMRYEITRELSSGKGRERALWKRGSQRLKSLMQGTFDTVKSFTRFRKRR